MHCIICKKEIGPKDYYSRFYSGIHGVELESFTCSSAYCYDEFHRRYMDEPKSKDFTPLPENIESRFEILDL